MTDPILHPDQLLKWMLLDVHRTPAGAPNLVESFLDCDSRKCVANALTITLRPSVFENYEQMKLVSILTKSAKSANK